MAPEEIDQSRDRIAETLSGRTLLITGGTGFVGKVLIEKILRCLDVKKIYVLVRPKKGKSPTERRAALFADPLFELAKKTRGDDVVKRVEFVSGDIAAPGLALSTSDRQKLAAEAEFIFHCAATIRFDMDLKPAVLLNVRGTKLMLELAKECKRLLNFVHLSTAYCHLNERVLYEKAYQPPADPDSIIKSCELMSNEAVNSIAPKLLEEWPNSYAFTKALGEALVQDQVGKIPLIILRPSIIMPVLKEPIPGWTDNINGPMGLLIAAGKGVLRTMYCKGEAYADYVPVDIVVNVMLCSACDRIVLKNSNRVFYNVTSSAEYKLTFQELVDIGRQTVYNKIPLNGVFWYPDGTMQRSRWVHNLAFFFYQWVPAVVVDILLVCLGYKPVLKRVQRRILKGYEVFEYYANRQWDFDNEGSFKARKLMTERERELYKVDGDGVCYEDYFYDCVKAARLYILHETDDTIPAAKRHMKVMYCVDKICKTLIMLGFIYLIWKFFLSLIFGF
ncbi:putative fatty acyl-CoA reductase CG5065 [Tribolium madens]|uniref:putative fatty acyl-CoA reductase CG5065 n=1 Tax=Tribolium madens TaxID=41895 RepID=UPI001CF738FC|nr:putative fatty acyl-CoA reductase CG5065 [Tribolium madens]